MLLLKCWPSRIWLFWLIVEVQKKGFYFALWRSCKTKAGYVSVVCTPFQETEIANYAALEVSDQSWKDFGNQACFLACRTWAKIAHLAHAFCFVTWPVADWQGRHGGVWGYIVPSLKFGKICTYKRNMEPDLKVLPQRLRVRVHMICVCWLWSQVFYRYSWEITASFSGRKATAFIPWFHHRHCIPICFCGSESCLAGQHVASAWSMPSMCIFQDQGVAEMVSKLPFFHVKYETQELQSDTCRRMAVRKEMLVNFVIFALQTGTQNFSIVLLFPCTFSLNADHSRKMSGPSRSTTNGRQWRFEWRFGKSCDGTLKSFWLFQRGSRSKTGCGKSSKASTKLTNLGCKLLMFLESYWHPLTVRWSCVCVCDWFSFCKSEKDSILRIASCFFLGDPKSFC